MSYHITNDPDLLKEMVNKKFEGAGVKSFKVVNYEPWTDTMPDQIFLRVDNKDYRFRYDGRQEDYFFIHFHKGKIRFPNLPILIPDSEYIDDFKSIADFSFKFYSDMDKLKDLDLTDIIDK